MRTHLKAASAATALFAATGVLAVSGPASATPARPAGCAPNERTIVTQTAVFYRSGGSAAGKRNGSNVKENLNVTLSVTATHSSAWEAGGSGSLSFGIAQVEAKTDYTVTKTSTKQRSVTDQIIVPAHDYGYGQPKVEYRTFHIYDLVNEPTCKTHVTKDYGYFDAIVASPFFAECVASKPCTPRP